MPAPAVSCVIPTHNRDDMLITALESVLAQTQAPHEVFVVDDLGRDECRTAVESIAEASPIAVTYVDGSTLTPKAAGASRNLGAAQATGDILAFLDDDDYWAPEFLADTLTAMDEHGCDFVVAWTRFERDGRHAPGLSMPAGLTPRTGLSRSGLTGSNAIVRRDAFQAIGGFDASLRVLNDFDYLRRLLVDGSTYCVIEQRLVTQVSHDLGHLSTRSLPRAEVIRGYRDRNATVLSLADKRHLSRMMHASSRGEDQSPVGRVVHGLLQACYTSPAEYLAGITRRLRTGSGMYA